MPVIQVEPTFDLSFALQFRQNGTNKAECDTFVGQVSEEINQSLIYAGFIATNIVNRTDWIVRNQNLYTALTDAEYNIQYQLKNGSI